MVPNGQNNMFLIIWDIWAHLDHFGPFKTKINFLPQKHKVLLGIPHISHNRHNHGGVLFSSRCTFFHRERDKDCFQQSLLREICTSLVMKVCQIHQTKHQVHQTKSMYAKQNTKYAKKTPNTPKNTKYAKKYTKYAKKTPTVPKKHQLRQKTPTMPKKHQIHKKNTIYAKKKHQILQKTPTMPKKTNTPKKHQIRKKKPTTPIFIYAVLSRKKFVPNLRTLFLYFLQA